MKGFDHKKIPEWLRYKKDENEKSPVWFIDVRGTDFSPDSLIWQKKINAEIEAVLKEIEVPQWEEPVLIKSHIGERRCRTRMLPEFCLSTVGFFRSLGMGKIVCGDSTVAYSGDRGYHDNHGECSRYLTLAEKHGWTEKGPLGTPFVVLDRPQTSIKGIFSFEYEEIMINPETSNRFRDVYLSGGIAAAGTIVNHVHLTLHDMAHVACAVKGITMGGSSYKGKLTMHKCYSPAIDGRICERCGICAIKCPEGALDWEKESVPDLHGDRCIGCGECMVVCPNRSISMSSNEIEDWSRGGESLPYRMADYIMGMMEGRWDRLLNVVHLYNITRRCDCVDGVQRPIVPHIGFLIGRNPFAIDLMSTSLLHEQICNQTENGTTRINASDILNFFDEYHGTGPYMHIQKEYEIVVEPNVWKR
ncbi:MAG: DUF362 domain-containing protein [Thermodesulfobacteriota bacterium]